MKKVALRLFSVLLISLFASLSVQATTARTPSVIPTAVRNKVDMQFSIENAIFTIISNNSVSFRYLNMNSDYDRNPIPIRIPESVTYGGKTFKVTQIEDNAFPQNSKISTIFVPKTIEKIGQFPFEDYCISEITVDKKNPYFLSNNGIVYSKDLKTLIRLPVNHPCTRFEIPQMVDSIYLSALRCCKNLKEVILPISIQNDQKIDFTGCKKLLSIEVSPACPAYTSQGGILFNKDITALLHYPAEITDTAFRLPKTVKTIKRGAFMGNPYLKYVQAPPGLKELGSLSFTNCSNLLKVSLSDSMQHIENSAFYGCTKLSRISIGLSTCDISLSNISGCPSFIEFEIDTNNQRYLSDEGIIFNKNRKTIYIYPPSSSKSTYIVPDMVTTIGANCFLGAESLQSIQLPNTLDTIGDRAFLGSRIRSIILPEHVKSIGMQAFWECYSLKSIQVNWKIPPFVSTNVFANYKNITLIVPDSSKTLYRDAPVWELFKGLYNNEITINGITYRQIDRNTLYIHSVDAQLDGIEIRDKLEYRGKSFTVACFDDNFVKNTKLKRLKLIGKEFQINQNIQEIFTNLSDIEIDEANPYYASVNGVLYSKNISTLICYPKGKMDANFQVPNTVNQLNGRAFYGCSNLKSVILPESLTTIESYAFALCTKLKSIQLPASLKHINLAAFWCDSALTSITIPNSVRELGGFAFTSCINLKTVTLSNQLQVIGDNAFWGCHALDSIVIPNSVLSMGDYVFSNCSGLQAVKLSEKLNTLNKSSFWGCRKLLEVSVPDAVSFIDNSVFESCISLKKVRLPKSLRCLSVNLFYNCNSLIELNLPDSLISIKNGAFFRCSSLCKLIIPDAVTNIDTSAFSNCSKLNMIHLPKNLKRISPHMLKGCESLITIDLPEKLEYIDIFGFAQCKSLRSIVIPSTVTRIGYSAFSNCTSLIYISLPSSLKQIEDFTFSTCTALQTIKLPNTMTSIGLSAFRDCSLLSSIELPDSVTELKSMAFMNCMSLKQVILPKFLTSISSQLFYKCNQLQSITIPSTVKTIEKNAFYLCENIRTIRMLNPKPIQVSGNVFSSISRDKCTLFVPSASLKLYKTSAYWSTFGNNIKPF